MTTSAQVQQAYAAANRGQTLDTASATAIAAQIDSSGGTFTLNTYVSQQFEANQNTTGLALEVFAAITGKTEATAADLTAVTNTVKVLQAAYPTLATASLPQAVADDLGAQLADNATGALFRSTNNLSGLYNNATANASTFDVRAFVVNQLTNVFGSAAASQNTTVDFETARFLELANRYKGFTDANDTTGYVRAAGALVAELINQGEQANNGNYHNAAVQFITQDATGTASYGSNLLASTGGTTGGGTGGTTGVGGVSFALTVNTAGNNDTFPGTGVGNANDDFINGLTADSLQAGDNINGGAGLDVLGAKFNAGNTAATALVVNEQNVEVNFFNVTGAVTEFVDLSIAAPTGLQQVWNENSLAGSTLNLTNLTLNSGTVGQTVGIAGGGVGGNTTTVAIAGATATTNATLNVALDNTVAGAAGFTDVLSTTFVKTVNLNLQSATGNALITNPDAVVGGFTPAANTNNSTLTLDQTGTALTSVAVKGAGALNLMFAAATKATVTSIDASGLSILGASTIGTANGITVSDAGFTKAVAITGSAQNDAITATSGVAGDVITGGKGADAITLGAASQTIKYLAGTDSTVTVEDIVTGFTTGSDKIDVKALGFTTGNTTIGTASNVPTGDTLGFFATSQVYAQTTGADTTVILDANHNGNFDAGTDLVIKFVGATPVIGDFVFA